jgi:hypothetical protein
MNPWKVTAIAMGLAMSTALITGLVVANWTGTERDAKPATAKSEPARPAAPKAAAPKPKPVATAQAATPTVPTQAAVEACNQWATQQVGPQDKTMEIVKDGAIGAVLGAAVGAAGGAIADGGKGAGKGAAIGGVVGAGGGALYGLNENRKNDERYRSAYSACMRGRGYAG